MSETLKSCPFCGSTNVELRKGAFWNGAVHCNDCTADVVFEAVELIAKGDYDWQTAVTKGWNARPDDMLVCTANCPELDEDGTPHCRVKRSGLKARAALYGGNPCPCGNTPKFENYCDQIFIEDFGIPEECLQECEARTENGYCKFDFRPCEKKQEVNNE